MVFWCGLTKLLGDEWFRDYIQMAIRERRAKFLFLLSTTSKALKESPG
jgi:hypothetical protein